MDTTARSNPGTYSISSNASNAQQSKIEQIEQIACRKCVPHFKNAVSGVSQHARTQSNRFAVEVIADKKGRDHY